MLDDVFFLRWTLLSEIFPRRQSEGSEQGSGGNTRTRVGQAVGEEGLSPIRTSLLCEWDNEVGQN